MSQGATTPGYYEPAWSTMSHKKPQIYPLDSTVDDEKKPAWTLFVFSL